MNKKIQQIEKENIVICIYFVLLFIYLYANTVEVEYIKYGNDEDKEKYRMLLYIVFGTTFILSLYFTIEGIKDLNNCDKLELYQLMKLSTLANILIVITSIIFLYIIYKDKDINLEVSL